MKQMTVKSGSKMVQWSIFIHKPLVKTPKRVAFQQLSLMAEEPRPDGRGDEVQHGQQPGNKFMVIHSTNGNFRILKWRYLPYIRPTFQAYVSEYHHTIWPYILVIRTGWWYTYPSEKYEFVSWDDYSIPNCFWKVIIEPCSSHHQPDINHY